MEWNKIYKIKDSVDVYLVDDTYLVTYFMNTRIRKKFKVNNAVIQLIQEIDGMRTAEEIYTTVRGKISRDSFSIFFDHLLDSKILCAKIDEADHVLDAETRERYARQISYFMEFFDSELEAEKAQKKLMNTRIGVIGCGAVGGDIAILLAMAGVEKLVLMDFDSVEISDCSRHMFFSQKDIGRKKVEVLSDYLKRINSRITTFISYEAYTPTTDMTDFLNHVDFVIDTADEPYLGYTANMTSELCVPKNVAHYNAGGFDAHLASTGELIIPYVTPCAACYSEYFGKVLKDWKPEHHPVIDRVGEIGGLSSLSLFAASYACIEIIKYICGLMDMNKNYHNRAEFYFDGMKLEYLKVEKDSNCRVCGRKNGNV